MLHDTGGWLLAPLTVPLGLRLMAVSSGVGAIALIGFNVEAFREAIV